MLGRTGVSVLQEEVCFLAGCSLSWGAAELPGSVSPKASSLGAVTCHSFRWGTAGCQATGRRTLQLMLVAESASPRLWQLSRSGAASFSGLLSSLLCADPAQPSSSTASCIASASWSPGVSSGACPLLCFLLVLRKAWLHPCSRHRSHSASCSGKAADGDG